MQTNKVNPNTVIYGVLAIVILVVLYKVYNGIFGKSDDQVLAEKEEATLNTQVIKGKTVNATPFENVWYNSLVAAYGSSVTTPAQNKYIAKINPWAKTIHAALHTGIVSGVLTAGVSSYVSDNDAAEVIGVFEQMPSKLSVYTLAYNYQRDFNISLLQDLKNGLDDNELAKLFSIINNKPVI